MIIGLTGGIASGKSTVVKLFGKESIPQVDADLVARDVVAPGTVGLQMITEAFGPEYLLPDGTLNRTKLGLFVFSNGAALKKLDALMGPLVQREADIRLNMLQQQHRMVMYNAALICENGKADQYRPLILVWCSLKIQVERLMGRNALTEAQAMDRISAQMPTLQKIKMADFVIDSNGTKDETAEQVAKVIAKLRKMYE